MNTPKESRDDPGQGWLFEQARQYPLLTASEEREIDAGKWRARNGLIEAMVSDPAGRSYLGLWIDNLLHNPPSLSKIADKAHYYTLRREQGELYSSEESASRLDQVLQILSSHEPDASRGRLLEALGKLNLSPPLVVGLANNLQSAEEPCGIAQALMDWQSSWPELPAQELVMEDESRAMLQAALCKYFIAREKLVNHNLRLVFSIAGKMTSPTVAFPDLVQSGVLGLIRAAEKYDYRAGHRFSTYAYNWINQSARRFMEEQRADVRLPADVTAQVGRLYRERMSYLNMNGRKPSLEQLAERLEMQAETVRRLQQVGNLPVAFDSPYDSQSDGPTVGERISGWAYPAPESRAERKSLHRCLMKGLKSLTKQEQRVVTLRWGLTNKPPLSRKQMASQLNLSSERIRQLESSALGKLRSDRRVAKAFEDYRD